MTQRLDYSAAAPEGMKTLAHVHGYIGRCGLPKSLVELVYLRSRRSMAAPIASACIRARCSMKA